MADSSCPSPLTRWSLQLLFLLALAAGLTAGQQAASCTSNAECGMNSTCNMSSCMCSTSFFSVSGSNTDCRALTDPDPRCSQFSEDCVFCGRNFTGPCQRCPELITEDGMCVETCENGEIEIIRVPIISRTARICRVPGPPFPVWAIIVIIVAAVIVLMALVFGLIGLLCCLERPSRGAFNIEGLDPNTGTMRTKRSNSFSFAFEPNKKDPELSLVHENSLFVDDDDEIDGDDETVFKHKLARLRKEAEVFLKMLNEMRRRARELPPDSPMVEHYKNVIRDVTRLLYLLNKKPANIRMPVDGLQLVQWSKSILKRYVASQEKENYDNTLPSYMKGSSRNLEEFMEKLNYLRDYSETFLRMLNEMRRRLKELRPDTQMAQNYRAITRDVTRVLDLLNKKPSSVEMPVDGLELVKKSESLLRNYLDSQGVVVDTNRLSTFGEQDVTHF